MSKLDRLIENADPNNASGIDLEKFADSLVEALCGCVGVDDAELDAAYLRLKNE